MTRVAVASPNKAFEQQLRNALSEQLMDDLHLWHGHVIDGARTASEIAPAGTEVVVLGPGLETSARFEIAATFDAHRPEISLVLVADRSPEVLDQALRTGIREVVPPDADGPELRAALERALARSRGRTQSVVVHPPEQPDSGPTVITVASPKGGAGKTIVATNLAVGLAARRPGEVALVDLDLQFGDVATALGMLPEHTIADVLRYTQALDATAVKAFLTAHPTSLHALCAPLSPAERDDIAAESAQKIVQVLSSQFSYVVVDTAAGLDEHALAALEVSTDCVFVATMDVPSVRSVRKELEILAQLGIEPPRRHLVVNRSETGLGMDAKDIGITIGMPVDVVVSTSRAVQLSMNQGTPVLQSDTRSPVGRQLDQLVDRFVAQTASAGRRLPLFRRSAT
jgi:pilus assembly protein CpaE